MKKNGFWIAIFLIPTLLLFALIFAASLATLIKTSFDQWMVGQKTSFVGFENYKNLFFNDPDFWTATKNTLIWVILQSTLHVLIGLVVALILSRKEFYWKFTRTVYMIPNIISSAAFGMLYLSLLNPEFGGLNQLIRFIGFKDFGINWFMDYSTSFFAVTMTWLPYAAVVTILVLSEMAAIPDSIFESAKIDGATEFKTNIYITIPMLKNILGTCVIVAATSMLQKMDIIFMTTSGGPGNNTLNLPFYIYRTALVDNNFGYANTIGTVLVVFGIFMIAAVYKLFRMGNSVA